MDRAPLPLPRLQFASSALDEAAALHSRLALMFWGRLEQRRVQRQRQYHWPSLLRGSSCLCNRQLWHINDGSSRGTDLACRWAEGQYDRLPELAAE